MGVCFRRLPAHPNLASPPESEAELLRRAEALAGRSLGAIAAELNEAVPEGLLRAKGWVGCLLERALGATAKSRATPDFEALGVELKSLPVDRRGQPLETTFVCTINLLDVGATEWASSRVFHKLQRVLWIPVLAERAIPVGERIVGSPLLWSPSAREEQQLRWDWEELAGLIGRGDVDTVTGHLGEVLQVRPKARNARSRRRACDSEGRVVEVLPRGFYLRPSFTARILRERLALPGGRG